MRNEPCITNEGMSRWALMIHGLGLSTPLHHRPRELSPPTLTVHSLISLKSYPHYSPPPILFSPCSLSAPLARSAKQLPSAVARTPRSTPEASTPSTEPTSCVPLSHSSRRLSQADIRGMPYCYLCFQLAAGAIASTWVREPRLRSRPSRARSGCLS